MSGTIIEKMDNFFCCLFGTFVLLGGERVECHEHGVVECSGIIEEGADKLLEAGLFSLGEEWGKFWDVDVLGVVAITGCSPRIR